jgi:DNA-directed RNA polymerase subunit P
MVLYKCFKCGKEIEGASIKRRIRCPYCGSKILFKPKIVTTKFKAV